MRGGVISALLPHSDLSSTVPFLASFLEGLSAPNVLVGRRKHWVLKEMNLWFISSHSRYLFPASVGETDSRPEETLRTLSLSAHSLLLRKVRKQVGIPPFRFGSEGKWEPLLYPLSKPYSGYQLFQSSVLRCLCSKQWREHSFPSACWGKPMAREMAGWIR